MFGDIFHIRIFIIVFILDFIVNKVVETCGFLI